MDFSVASRLYQLSAQARKHVVRMTAQAKSSHVGSGLSAIDILVNLYFKCLKHDPASPSNPSRDIFILSKGHGSAALYAVLSLAGYFPEERLIEYYGDGGSMPGHPALSCVPGVEASTGSLGHGLAIGLGQALGQKLQKYDAKTYVLLGDGECNEGSIWEAAMYAAKLNLHNLIAIVDYNGLQGLGRSSEISALEPLADKWVSFGWNTLSANGHKHQDLTEAFERASSETVRPTVILAKTVKGKGVSFMEDRLEWHYKSVTPEQEALALEELSQ